MIYAKEEQTAVSPSCPWEGEVHVVWARPVEPQELYEARIESLDRLMKAGHLDLLERAFNGRTTLQALATGNTEWIARVNALKAALPEARMREAEAGGPGSLIDYTHPLTIHLEKERRANEAHAAWLEQNKVA